MHIIEAVFLTRHLSELKRFYAVALGLPLVDESAGRFTVGIGRSALTFQHVTSASTPIYHFAFNIPENQIQAARHWLGGKVNPLAHEEQEIITFESWNAHAVYFLDPAGNIVELIARHSLPSAAHDAFGPGAFLEISEIGLPCADVAATTNSLHEAFGQNLWKGNGQTFNAVGDEHGLFILVSLQRPWFMTRQPAAIFPISITISGPELQHLEPESGAYRISQALAVF